MQICNLFANFVILPNCELVPLIKGLVDVNKNAAPDNVTGVSFFIHYNEFIIIQILCTCSPKTAYTNSLARYVDT